MPQQRKPARLYFREDEGQWIIHDGARSRRTGCRAGELAQAEQALMESRAERAAGSVGPAHPSKLTVGVVLAAYVDSKTEAMRSKAVVCAVKALAPVWGDLTCDAVKGETCRRYERSRGVKPGTVRRELGTLQAALNHAHAEGILIHPIKVTLPRGGAAGERWLTRSEAVRLVRRASQHLRRYILIALYTGRRNMAILDLTWTRVDVERGVVRFATGPETKKRRGSLPVPRQLHGHLRRWVKMGQRPQMNEHNSARIQKAIRTKLRSARVRAGLSSDVTPHVLKHTAITWAVQSGLGLEAAAEYFDTSASTIRAHCWHHSPLHHAEGRAAVERGER